MKTSGIVVFCSLFVMSVKASAFDGSIPRSQSSPVSAWMNRNQDETSKEEIQHHWIIDKQLRLSKAVSSQTFAPNKQNSGFPATSALRKYLEMQDAVLRETKLQSALIAENYLRQHADPCMENSYCHLGQSLEEEGQSFTNELLSMDVLKRMLNSVMDDPETDQESLPQLYNIRSIVSAFELGIKTGNNMSLCDHIFPCAADPKKQGRSFCNTAKNVCPGLAISCSMCGIFNPQLCRRVCIATATSCGLSIYSCMIARAVTKTTLAPTTASSATTGRSNPT
jgi:hypothetical protein